MSCSGQLKNMLEVPNKIKPAKIKKISSTYFSDSMINQFKLIFLKNAGSDFELAQTFEHGFIQVLQVLTRDCFALQWFEDKLGCHGQ